MARTTSERRIRGKFNNEQKAFLLAQVDRFRNAQQNSSTRAFLSSLYILWFEKWPIEGGGDSGMSSSDDFSEDSPPTPRQLMMKRIKNWFYNSRVGRLHRDERPVVLDLKKGSRRVLQPYQAYMKLYKAKMRSTVLERYNEQLRAVRSGEKLPDRLTISREVAHEFLEKESPEVRAEVEHYRLHGEVDDDLDDKEKGRRRAINSLPKTIQRAALNIQQETGWVMSIFLGGIDPDSGDIMSYIYHKGRTQDQGETWDQFEPGWEEVHTSFDQFLAQCFPQEQQPRKLLNVGKRGGTADVKRLDSETPQRRRSTSIESEIEPVNRQQDEVRSEPSSRSSTPEVDTPDDPVTPSSTGSHNSQRSLTFDEQRERNIAENRNMFQTLGLDQVALGKPRPRRPQRAKAQPGSGTNDSEDDSSTTSGASNDLNTPTNKDTHPSTATSSQSLSPPITRSSSHQDARTDTSGPGRIAANTNTTAAAVTASTCSNSSGHVTTHRDASESVSRSNSNQSPSSQHDTSKTLSLVENQGPDTNSTDPTRLNVVSDSIDPSPSSGNPSGAARNSQSTTPSSPATVYGPGQGVPMTPPQLVSPRSSSPPSPPTNVALTDGNPAAPSASPDAPPSPSQPNTDGMDDIQPISPDAVHDNDAMEDIQPTSPTPSTSFTLLHTSTRALPDSLPDSIRLAANYMLALSSNSTWHHLVLNWVHIEETLGYPGNESRLSTTNRPEEVSQFIRSRRQYTKAPVLTMAKLRPYSAMWKSWWKILQPDGRDVSQWPFPRDADTNCNWTSLLQGGVNGLYLIVVSLGWWIVAASKVAEDKPVEWQQAADVMDDVDWVFECLLTHARQAKDVNSEGMSPPAKKSRRA